MPACSSWSTTATTATSTSAPASTSSIRELAEKVRDVVYPDAELRFDTSKPDGTPRKVLDTSKLNALGWSPTIDLGDGIRPPTSGTSTRWPITRCAATSPTPSALHSNLH